MANRDAKEDAPEHHDTPPKAKRSKPATVSGTQ
jgi:hypothetical protein